jgi:hypothetical protein
MKFMNRSDARRRDAVHGTRCELVNVWVLVTYYARTSSV